MAKAKVKAKLKTVEDLSGGVKARDLSLEKRIELYNEEFQKFKNDTAERYGLVIGVEIAYNPQGILPRLSLYDLLKNENKDSKTKQG